MILNINYLKGSNDKEIILAYNLYNKIKIVDNENLE